MYWCGKLEYFTSIILFTNTCLITYLLAYTYLVKLYGFIGLVTAEHAWYSQLKPLLLSLKFVILGNLMNGIIKMLEGFKSSAFGSGLNLHASKNLKT